MTDDTFELSVTYQQTPLPDEDVEALRREAVDGLADLGFVVTKAWQLGRDGGSPYE